MQPETRYAKSGDLHIAYQVAGNGPIDLVFPPVWYSHVEAVWDWQDGADFLRRLASFSRLIIFDQRGTGASDPIPFATPPTLEERADDVRAVMDAAASDRAAILGSGSGGALAALFAATHPDRVIALILLNASARPTRAPDYPMGLPPERMDETIEHLRDTWGREERLSTIAGNYTSPPDRQESRKDTGDREGPPAARARRTYDERARKELARYERIAMSPGSAAAVYRMVLSVDIREVLPAIRVPTLVLHHRDNTILKPTHGRYLAEHIQGARFVELEGESEGLFFRFGQSELDDIQEFLTGMRPAPRGDRVLATVLFTDVVQSTAKASALGDDSWRQVLTAHAALISRQVDRFRGKVIRVAGEESLATFDGPARAIHCALAVREGLRSLDLDVRSGLHTGEIELLTDDIGGLAVHIGARVSAMAGPGEVLVSSTVKDLVIGSGIAFEDRGTHELKGVPDHWRVYAVVD